MNTIFFHHMKKFTFIKLKSLQSAAANGHQSKYDKLCGLKPYGGESKNMAQRRRETHKCSNGPNIGGP